MPRPRLRSAIVFLVTLAMVAVGPRAIAAERRVSSGPKPASDQARAVVIPKTDRGFTIAVLGDGFAEALSEGLALTYGDQSDVTILDKTHAPFGLSQNEKFEWPVAVQNLFSGRDRIDAAVIMLGANDTMPITQGTAVVDLQTPQWRQLYGERVAAVAGLFQDRHVPLTWVGLPIVGDADLSAKFVVLNEIIRDRAVKAGATYVDSWEAFSDEAGQYSGSGPDLNGRIVKLRAADGIDFTRAGERKLASFVEGDIRRDQQRAAAVSASATTPVNIPDQPGFDNALEVDIGAQIRREAGLPALLPDKPAAAGLPKVGRVISLTTPARSIDGRLADTEDPLFQGRAYGEDHLAERSLVAGLPIQPRPSRSDDFTWPKR